MFQPSRDDVRRYFCGAWSRYRQGLALAPQERIAVAAILEHPEYHALLEDIEQALAAEFAPEGGRENPFLHLSMHVALHEQGSIDQPRGIRALLEGLQRRHGHHQAEHEAMECLGEILWRTQRGTLPADMERINLEYLDCLQRRLGRETE